MNERTFSMSEKTFSMNEKTFSMNGKIFSTNETTFSMIKISIKNKHFLNIGKHCICYIYLLHIYYNYIGVNIYVLLLYILLRQNSILLKKICNFICIRL